MKTKHLITVLLVISASLGIVSCDDDDERFFLYQIDDIYFPDRPISGVTVEITGSSSVGMTGGVAPYTVETGDERIAKAKINEEYGYVTIGAVQLGTTDLIVRDANGLTAKIEVKVIKGRSSFYTKYGVSAQIEGLGDSEKAVLEKQVIADSDMQVTGRFDLVYDTKDDGMLTISLRNNDANPILASFTREIKQVDEKTFTSYIYVNYKGADHVFYYAAPEKPLLEDGGTRALGPMRSWLVEDVTEIYKNAYPQVTSVKRIYDGETYR